MELNYEKKGGPYTKNEKRKRLDEVYRLHFEYGYSARKIANFLKINRGTINRDIMYWHADFAKKQRHLEPEVSVMNQIERLEIQRTRQREQLDKLESFQEKMISEKFIFNIDVKIADIKIKLIDAERNIQKEIINGINNWCEKEKNDRRFISPDIFLEVSKKANEKIRKMYTEDMKF